MNAGLGFMTISICLAAFNWLGLNHWGASLGLGIFCASANKSILSLEDNARMYWRAGVKHYVNESCTRWWIKLQLNYLHIWRGCGGILYLLFLNNNIVLYSRWLPDTCTLLYLLLLLDYELNNENWELRFLLLTLVVFAGYWITIVILWHVYIAINTLIEWLNWSTGFDLSDALCFLNQILSCK